MAPRDEAGALDRRGVAACGIALPAAGRVVTPDGMSTNRIAAGGNAASGGKGRSSLAGRKAGPENSREFRLALAHAEGVDGGCWRIGQRRGTGVQRWCGGLALGRWWGRLGQSRPQPLAVPAALGLLPPALFAVVGGSVALAGIPAPPASCGHAAGGATVALLEMVR